MAAIHREGEAYYLGGVVGVPDLCWRREADRWVSAPAALPSGAQKVTVQELPDDLREELLAFVARAQAMGSGRLDSGN
ncbi:MAG: hypothetical protein HOM68_19580 [Gemmatimonadetes bacterium]|jgi:hypothetical protein|nr:hypothetical protein [Gemmatimonadota bacterium]MBT5058753.1 hypothetical protein [Gemmatimonadota bacterium]MBT5144282.1 hypothetical protein [Gemmatimonadota bacterium]MBT5588692.1 hypothetical protein [Gemmatimonadota bacterium]MBT5964590.1 hypothetical protein [Gemmatimonadota bacterium]